MWASRHAMHDGQDVSKICARHGGHVRHGPPSTREERVWQDATGRCHTCCRAREAAQCCTGEERPRPIL